ncbi:EP300-interacting inhibitor of differentiation 1-like [Mesoplodon densirostris]|uniref:EP300-interacting inhibitor of differentiation 1-like n=1 Tax=Mesoplodon densirostris TaxID=48708 RepID=UPI0028DB855B|nr:EP300-interacting inhibitor of differentiation 1-like [Mesoplodon densirostris]
MDLMPGKSDLPQTEVGSGSREPSPNPRTGAQDGPVEEEEAQPTAEPQGDRGLEFDDWEDHCDYLAEEQLSGAGCRVSAALGGDNVFLRTSRVREAALDGGFQMGHENTSFDQLAFVEKLFSLMVGNRLTEELGCD